ncbi:hypothetical protein DSUL_140054 [Desulfovibrionales bacterium]
MATVFMNNYLADHFAISKYILPLLNWVPSSMVEVLAAVNCSMTRKKGH